LENSRPPAFGLRPAIFRGTLGNWGIHNVNYDWKIAGLRPSASGLLFSVELLEIRGIHNMSYLTTLILLIIYTQIPSKMKKSNLFLLFYL